MYGCSARSIWLCLIFHLDLGHPLDFLHIDTSSASLDLAAFLHTFPLCLFHHLPPPGAVVRSATGAVSHRKPGEGQTVWISFSNSHFPGTSAPLP